VGNDLPALESAVGVTARNGLENTWRGPVIVAHSLLA